MVTRGGGGVLIPVWHCTEGKVSLTGGPHLNPVVLVSLADSILGTEDEAVVPRVLEDVGQVKRCPGQQHRVALSVLQCETLRLEAPAHMQRWAKEEQICIFRKGWVRSRNPDRTGKLSRAEVSSPLYTACPVPSDGSESNDHFSRT